MELDLEHKKIELIQWLSTLSDSDLIDKLMELRKSEGSNWWKDLSIGEKESIEKGINDAEEGRLNSHSKAKEIYGKWL